MEQKAQEDEFKELNIDRSGASKFLQIISLLSLPVKDYRPMDICVSMCLISYVACSYVKSCH